MNKHLTIEQVGYNSTMGVVRQILSQPEIYLVAVGSAACTKSLEYIANSMNARERLVTRALTAKDYTLGKNARAMVGLVQKVLDAGAAKGIILYPSCLDILTNFDEQEILSALHNPQQIPVAVLRRGPLVKRKLLPREALQKIWETWGLVPLAPLTTNLPVSMTEPLVDFEQIIYASDGSEDILLISPGGCASCLREIFREDMDYVYATRFDDLFLCRACADDFVEAVLEFFDGSRPLLLLGTAVSKAVGISLEEIARKLHRQGRDVRYLTTDGYKKC
ncbi:MAG: hypothetical protein Q4D21_05255 [Phascolarctobacterium sp.]|nr:hypothetical protein [Phascolarctobacterium sp.]